MKLDPYVTVAAGLMIVSAFIMALVLWGIYSNLVIPKAP